MLRFPPVAHTVVSVTVDIIISMLVPAVTPQGEANAVCQSAVWAALLKKSPPMNRLLHSNHC